MGLKILLLMVLLHIIDDFFLQGMCLSKLKQKETWTEYNEKTNNLYKYDYIVALFIHGLSWSIMAHLPLFFFDISEVLLIISVFINAIVHSYIDDIKANKKKINLVTDQFLHFLQILIIYFIF